MKVLYVASGTRMSGGATKSLLSMLEEAAKAGIDYQVVCPDSEGVTTHLRSLGVTVHVVPFRHACLPPTWGAVNKLKWLPRLIHNSWINIRGRRGVYEVAREFSPDIIHENSSVIDVGYYAARRLGIPDVIHIREYGDLDFKMKLPGRDRRIGDENSYTISITKDIAKHKRQHLNPRGVQIYNGIIKAGEMRYTPEKSSYFLYAGRIEKAKGITELLDAYMSYVESVDRALPLWIAGGCNYPDFLEKEKSRVLRRNMGDNVIWLGDRNDIADLMYKATATIIPSRHEALGRVMPEAMANGSLCIGRYTGGTREQLDNGRMFTGRDIALKYDTTAELTEIMKDVAAAAADIRIFESGGDYFEMIGRSMRTVDNFFSTEKFGVRLVEFYKRILDSGPR